jgi:rubrerythrin
VEEGEKSWRREREAFVKAMRVSKEMGRLEKEEKLGSSEELRAKIKALQSQIPSQTDSNKMKECPHCKRSFLDNVADRHIPICQHTKHRPKPPPTKDEVAKNQDIRRSVHLSIGSPRQNESKLRG